MPYKSDETDKLPAKGLDEIIWRYMDLVKFLDLIDGRLFFPTIRTLAKEDRFEGSFPKVSQQGLEKCFIQETQSSEAVLQPIRNHMSILHEATRQWVFASCWHINEFESAAMWSQYARQGDGIAIKSTLRNLMDSFELEETKVVRICEIEYINYNLVEVPWHRIYLFKRLSYSHERELRAFYCPGLFKEPNPDAGISLTIDPGKLINEVRIGPNCKESLLTTVQASLDKWNLGHKRAEQSELSAYPI